jgi:3-hydroxyacyl-CoA dehydrogenase
VVEAIIENAEAKRALFRELEAKVDARCVLASNTSSISVTALANGLKAPGRFVGMHFFNPVPLMKLVEVVSGLETDPAVAQAIFELSQRWGKTPVHARSTRASSSTALPGPTTPRPWRCCSSASPSRRCSTRACAAAAFAWGRASSWT